LLKAENAENAQPLQASAKVVQPGASADMLQASAKVVPASVSTSDAEQPTMQPAVFVVVESQQYGNAVIWQVSYWQIMIVQPNPQRVLHPHVVSENPSKSI
jgi:hypothetical protein